GISIILKDKLEEMNNEVIIDFDSNVEDEMNENRDRYIKAVEHHINALEKIINKYSNLKFFIPETIETTEYGENTFF
ncbi:MAG: hypothetical protein ACRC7R_05905, partial [Sarcina sp.]